MDAQSAVGGEMQSTYKAAADVQEKERGSS